MLQHWRSCYKKCTCEIWKPYGNLFWLRNYSQSLFFLVGQTSRSRALGQNFWYLSKGLVTKNVHIKALPLLVRKLWPRLKFFKSRPSFKVKVTMSKLLEPMERFCHKECTYEIWKPYLFWLGSYGQGYSFLKVGQTSRSRSLGQKFLYSWKGLVTRNAHMKISKLYL